MNDITDLDLLKELGVELKVEKPKQYTAVEARLIAGFEDILRFYEQHNRAPRHGEHQGIFERLYAVRLDQLRNNKQALALLSGIDIHDLLVEGTVANHTEPARDEDLLAELGIDLSQKGDNDITTLRHVSPVAQRRLAEEVANRDICKDFDKFDPLFTQVQQDLKTGVRATTPNKTQEAFQVGNYFILNGQLAYIAERGDEFQATGKNRTDARLRVIFDNGTESNMLFRSLQRALNDDERGRTISDLKAGPLFSDTTEEELQTGTIYVLRSKSDLPEIASIRDAILKIGVTSGDVKKRIANAQKEATYLLGEVEIVDTYELYNINRIKLEKMLHRVFADARLNAPIPDRFGNPFEPREWFFLTREIISEAVELIRSEEIQHYKYDYKNLKFIKSGVAE